MDVFQKRDIKIKLLAILKISVFGGRSLAFQTSLQPDSA